MGLLKGSVEEKLAKLTMGESPVQLMLGRPIWTRLDLVKPKQSRKSASAKNRATHQLEVGDAVMARNYGDNLKWRSGKEPLMYKIMVASSIIWHRHIDQLLPNKVKPNTIEQSTRRGANLRCGSSASGSNT